jgi:hypothetical protein
MDGDGDLDIVSSSFNDDTIAWYENDGGANPTWSATDIATSADGAHGLHVADMDGDGDLDIISASFNDDTIAWYENDGGANPTWSATDIATSAGGATGVHVADMDGDGDLDIVSASSNDDTIAWYENDGEANPTWAAADIATSADGAKRVYVADMDGDGDLDIVSASYNDDTIAWYENDGGANPTWAAADIATSADAAYGVHVADMDGDGDLDIVSASLLDDTIAWYENDGAANPSWNAVDIATSAQGARDVHVADMDGDGDLDIVSASSGDDTIAWYENNCNGNDPLIFDLDDDGIELLGLDANINFDIDVDGALETTGWVAPDDGLLVFDLDGSGVIENMSEVFSQYFQSGGFRSSLEALASLDSNADQIIDQQDDLFEKILLWRDADSDAVSTKEELFQLSELNIDSISLMAESSNSTINGNQIDSLGTFYRTSGLTGTFAEVTFATNLFQESLIVVGDNEVDELTGQEQHTNQVLRLYNAAFDRSPDSDELDYWIDQYTTGADDAKAVASSILVSNEFTERYGDNLSNETFVEALYVNVLGRDYDQEGYDYWLGNLNNGTETRYELLLGFAESAENKTLFTEMTGLS